MGTPDENGALLKVAQAISDGQPVDWEALATSQKDAGVELSHLKAMAALAEAHRKAVPKRTPNGHDWKPPARPLGAGLRKIAWLLAAVAGLASLAFLLYRLLT